MPITLQCSCGKSYRLKDELAGRKVRCTGCNNIQTVPQPKPAEDEFEEVELEEIPKVRAAQSVREAACQVDDGRDASPTFTPPAVAALRPGSELNAPCTTSYPGSQNRSASLPRRAARSR